MQDRWLTGLFFIAGVIAGVLGMRLLGLPAPTAPPATPPAEPARLNLGDLGLRLPAGESESARGALQQGLQLGRLYQSFASGGDAGEPPAPLPTIPAYNTPVPVSPSAGSSSPAEAEPIQPLEPAAPAMRSPARAPLFAIPPVMRDALRASR